MKTKVFIVDDHYMIVEGIRSLLSDANDIEWMGHAMNATSCMAFLTQNRPDVILMDINLPDKSGIELCKEVKDHYPEVNIVGLSSHNQLSFIKKIMDHGASGYVLKNATQEELVLAIKTVVMGEIFLSDEASVTIDNQNITKLPIITRREKEVLLLISEGLTNHEIAEKLFVSTTTVDTHRKNLLAKFEAKNTASLIRLATQSNVF